MRRQTSLLSIRIKRRVDMRIVSWSVSQMVARLLIIKISFERNKPFPSPLYNEKAVTNMRPSVNSDHKHVTAYARHREMARKRDVQDHQPYLMKSSNHIRLARWTICSYPRRRASGISCNRQDWPRKETSATQ